MITCDRGINHAVVLVVCLALAGLASASARGQEAATPQPLPPTVCTDNVWAGTSGFSLPRARHHHEAVWTGSEFLIWGGQNDQTYFNDGARTDLQQFSAWKLLAKAGSPAGRSTLTAVWTGTEMIVWGGRNAEGNLGTGGRYNPATDTWTAVSDVGAPTPRREHVAFWTGTEMLVWGGVLTNTGGIYNPATNTWRPTSTVNAPAAASGFTAVWTGTEMIVWGGNSALGLLNTGARYNPQTDTWTGIAATGAPTPRSGHCAVWTATEMIVWGGSSDSNYLASGGRFNPQTSTWTATNSTNAPSGRTDHTAIWTGAEMIVWGGTSRSGVLATGGRYSPATDMWRPTPDSGAPVARRFHTATWTGTEMVIWGGSDGTMPLATGSRLCATVSSSAPKAAFTFAPTEPTYGQAVQFMDASTGAPTAWLWNFGDGTTSTARNPVHTYSNCGSFTVSLKASNSSGSSTESKALTVGGCTSTCAALRALPGGYSPAQAVNVTITVTPPSYAQNFAVEDAPPAGWAIASIDLGGSFDAVNGKVKWGPFLDAQKRTLHYQATPPAGTSGTKSFAGTVSINGVSQPICGATTLGSGQYHPADQSSDFRINIDEFTSYGAAWKSGATWPQPPNPVPIDFMTNAGLIWRSGEAYHYDASLSPPWTPGASGPAAGPRAPTTSPGEPAIGAGSAVASCEPSSYTPGLPVQVSIVVTPAPATMVYAVEDAPPAGWAVSNVEGGQYDATTRKVKFGPAFDSEPRTFVYSATPPANESGTKSFAGVASFDGTSVAITGERAIGPAFSTWIPVATHATGKNSTQWRTDVGVLNTGGLQANIDVRLFTSDGILTKSTFVPAGAQSILVDVVDQLAFVGSGALEVRSDQPVKVTSRTYNDTTEGTFGQDHQSSLATGTLAAGNDAWLPQLTENDAYRTNIAVTNTGSSNAGVTVVLIDGAGNELARYGVELRPGQYKQENQPFRNRAGQSNMGRGYARIHVDSGAGVVATASVIDNRTNDPTTIVAVR